MRMIERLLRWIVTAGAFTGVACIIALMFLTVVTVSFRAIGIAFPGTYTLAEMLLIPSISFSLAYAAYEGAHTRVELMTSILPPRLASLLDALMLALGTVFWVVVAYAGTLEALKSARNQEQAPILGFPVTPFRWMLVIAITLLCLVLVVQVVQALRRTKRVKEASEGSQS